MARLVTEMRAALRARGYAPRTERVYVRWIVRYVRHCGLRHPRECGDAECRAFVEHLAGDRGASASMVRQAVAALRFLYRDVLRMERQLGGLSRAGDGDRHARPVLAPPEVLRILDAMAGAPRLVAMLMYGAGLRLEEAVMLRLRDVDAARCALFVAGQGRRPARRVMLPARLMRELGERVLALRLRHLAHVQRGRGVLAIDGGVVRDWRWAWLFPATRASSTLERPMHGATVRRALSVAGRKAGIGGPVSPRMLRASFAVQMLHAGYPVRTVQELLGHSRMSTTLRYLPRPGGATAVRGPLDWIPASPEALPSSP